MPQQEDNPMDLIDEDDPDSLDELHQMADSGDDDSRREPGFDLEALEDWEVTAKLEHDGAVVFEERESDDGYRLHIYQPNDGEFFMKLRKLVGNSHGNNPVVATGRDTGDQPTIAEDLGVTREIHAEMALTPSDYPDANIPAAGEAEVKQP